ncbi:MAG TPA: hypothetical protein VMF67_08085 [Rhizomicrobium sp.]|nr:hypothetical protein [Rhizomicrobium sp.]
MASNRPLAHVGPYEAPYVAPKKNSSGTWADLTATLPFSNGPWGAMLLTDGTVIVQDYCTSPAQWYKLTPDSKGQYSDGTWSKIATMPSGYSPLFFAQQVLTDGRVIINGGEYNDCNGDWTNKGALYNPQSNSWTSVSAPSGWSTIGDAESIILPNGTYMLANCCDDPGEQALASISGTTVKWTTGSSYDYNDEQGYTPLPDGNVLMVDVWNHGSDYDDYEIYDTSTGAWSLAGETADYLSSPSTYELGAAPLTPQGPAGGTIIQFSANTSLGVNDVYSVANGKWTSGPVMKVGNTIYDCADAPATTLPDGNILVQASPGTFSTPSHFWEFRVSKKGKVKAVQVNDTKQAGNTSSFESTMLDLPTGQVLWDNSQATPEVALYTPNGKPKKNWLPVVSSVSSTLTVGSTANAISGTNFNGWDLGGTYGDDAQSATNWPIVRITNNSSGDVCYGHSYSFSTMGVWTTGTTNAVFDVPSTCQTGASTLQVIVNGIASTGVSVTLNS